MLKKSLNKTIDSNDMVVVKIVREMISTATKKDKCSITSQRWTGENKIGHWHKAQMHLYKLMKT